MAEEAKELKQKQDSTIHEPNSLIDNIFYERVKVLLEGVEVPFSSVSVSYGITGLPSCTIVLPAAYVLRDLPETTKVLVLYCDPDDDSLPKSLNDWNVLFEGELGSISYSYNSSGGVLYFNAIHILGLLDNIQLLTQDAIARLTNIANIGYSGVTTVSTVTGLSIEDNTILEGLFGKTDKNFTSMSEMVAAIIETVLNNKSTAASTKIARERLIEKEKITERIFGVDLPKVRELVTSVLNKINTGTTTNKEGNSN